MIASGMTDDPSLPATKKTAILVAAFDSQLKWAETIRRAMESRGFACQLIVPSDIRHAVSDRQMEDYCQNGLTYMPWTELMTASLNAEVVVLAIQGPQVQRFCHDLFDAVELTGASPQITISGWVGVIIENITAGYLARYTTDIVAVNSPERPRYVPSGCPQSGPVDGQSAALWLATAVWRAPKRADQHTNQNRDVRRPADCAADPRGPALRLPAADGVRPRSSRPPGRAQAQAPYR